MITHAILDGGFWKHLRFMDVVAQIISGWEDEKGDMNLYVSWWVVGAAGNLRYIGVDGLIVIAKEDLHSWRSYDY